MWAPCGMLYCLIVHPCDSSWLFPARLQASLEQEQREFLFPYNGKQEVSRPEAQLKTHWLVTENTFLEFRDLGLRT